MTKTTEMMQALETKLANWAHLATVTGTWISGQLPDHAKLTNEFGMSPIFQLFQNDDKLPNMMLDLNKKEADGDTDYAMRMVIKHITTRAMTIIGEWEQNPHQSTSPQVAALGQMLTGVYESLDGFKEFYSHILNNPDRRNVPDQLREALGDVSMSAFANRMAERTRLLNLDFERFQDSLYALELEESTGEKGKWREIADQAKRDNYRVSIAAVTELRRVHGVGLREAKNVVEAYMDGMFQ
uniref:Uncharacterized protein n=1 Tax=Pseudomonas phage RVTF4 TaxID=3236931 RepID=A0AB39CD48_9VIRU